MELQEISLDEAHDTRQIRNALGRFPTGVTVITTQAPDGKREGLTANSFSALSLDPPLILWSISRRSPSLAGFLASGHFAINVLSAGQAEMSHRFATPSEDKFAGLKVGVGVGASPLLEGVIARFECSIDSTVDGGDHLLFVGRVHRLAYGDGEPLIFNAGRYCTALTLRTGTAASDLDGIWAGLG
ncbi:flavin reductase family protein [Hydrogenophaga sp. BPS33]|uniref:flavin reductase family protein n=1 Tax=Hydrogenophaga sp. BPS33 TaxID=2651974 RepID=UPI00131FA7F3|nr:flavin reductase family protein [Hydrogenophaga sp. BPS33]QHE84849.1 flavin reductase family protein [Hydrogenophaga sp. BPS33]